MPLSPADISQFCQSQKTVLVELITVKGSSPREVGAWMLVSATGQLGTIGGGQLEYMMMDEARKMLRLGQKQTEKQVPLGPEIGQCCGGHVVVALHAVLTPDPIIKRLEVETAKLPEVLIFGAGHVGKALAQALQPLPVRPILIDQRATELSPIKNIETRLSALPEAELRNAKPNSAVVIVTHDHALDFLIAGEALNRGDFSYVGMIGSKTKRVVFGKWAQENYPHSDFATKLICPIGGSNVRDKRPEIIAALVAAELIEVFDQKGLLADAHTIGGNAHA